MSSSSNAWRVIAVVLIAVALVVAISDDNPFNDGFGETITEPTVSFMVVVSDCGMVVMSSAPPARVITLEVATRPA